MRTVTIEVLDRNFTGELDLLNPIRELKIQSIDVEPELSANIKQMFVLGTPQNESVAYICGEQINSHTPVVLVSNKIFKLNNLDNSHQFAFVGFTKTSGNLNDTVFVAKEKIDLQGWSLIPNVNYLAAENGAMQIVNNGPGFTQIIGKSQDSNTLLIVKHYTPIKK